MRMRRELQEKNTHQKTKARRKDSESARRPLVHTQPQGWIGAYAVVRAAVFRGHVQLLGQTQARLSGEPEFVLAGPYWPPSPPPTAAGALGVDDGSLPG